MSPYIFAMTVESTPGGITSEESHVLAGSTEEALRTALCAVLDSPPTGKVLLASIRKDGVTVFEFWRHG